MKDKRTVRELIVVEGRYDKSAVLGAVNATVIETSGFGILKDKDKVSLLRRLSEKNGLIVLTDSDRAGFFIRGRLNSMLGSANVKHAYIPDVLGKERRKAAASKEGKLGVEGMGTDILLKSLEVAGATFEDGSERGEMEESEKITMTDMFEAGLTGYERSAQKRRSFLIEMGLPTKLSTKAALNVLNVLMSRDEFLQKMIYNI
jgi:ribonuclease M5